MQAAMRSTHPNPQAGFTLVEVILSIWIMAFVFMAGFSAYFLGMDMIETAREDVRASQIIQSELERLRTKNWDQILKLPKEEYFEPQGTFVKQYAKDYTAVRRVLVYGTNQRFVYLTVQWKDSKGAQKEQYFLTVFTKNGLNDYYYRDI